MTQPANPAPNEDVEPSSAPLFFVCSFESRKQDEMRSLIERHGGQATIAPSLREVPLESNTAVFEFLRRLESNEIEAVIFMTGVGAKTLLDVVVTREERGRFFDQLQRCCLIVRGPKPTAVLREWGVRIDHRAPEPNTWKELLQVMDSGLMFPMHGMGSSVAGKTIAIQEYGLPSFELQAALRERGANVVSVPVYRWELPLDTGPLEGAIQSTIAGLFRVLLFTSAQQIRNVLDVSERLGIRNEFLNATARVVVGSIGPTCSEALREVGLHVDLQPSHPHMGHLVKETLAYARTSGQP